MYSHWPYNRMNLRNLCVVFMSEVYERTRKNFIALFLVFRIIWVYYNNNNNHIWTADMENKFTGLEAAYTNKRTHFIVYFRRCSYFSLKPLSKFNNIYIQFKYNTIHWKIRNKYKNKEKWIPLLYVFQRKRISMCKCVCVCASRPTTFYM